MFVEQGPFVFGKLESISVPQENCIFIIGGEYLTKTIEHIMSDIDGKPCANVNPSTKFYNANFKISQIQRTSIATFQSVGRRFQSLKRRKSQRKRKAGAMMSKPRKMNRKKLKHTLTIATLPIII